MQCTRIAMKSLVFAFATAISTISAAAQTTPEQPDALDLLKNVELTYGAMNTYSAKVTGTMAMNGAGSPGKMNMNMETSMTITADASGKFRKEITGGMMGMTLVYDGSTMWMYMAGANSYSKLSGKGASSSVEAGAMDGGVFGSANVLGEYKNITRGVMGAKVLRSEKLRVNASDVDCWVVSLDYGPSASRASAALQEEHPTIIDSGRSKMLWVDKNRFLVYQDASTSKMTMGNTNASTSVKLTSKVESFTVNDPVSPEVFTFTPPAGAKELDESKYMPKTGEVPKAQN